MRIGIKRHRGVAIGVIFGLIVGLIATLFITISTKTPQALTAEVKSITNQSTSEISFAWPAGGQAVIGTLDDGIKSNFGDEEQHPTASLAKVITALVVLDEKPLSGDGPLITLTEEDVRLYEQTVAAGGSYLYVKVNEQLTQRQMIEALMLPSANNIADSLVRWAFESQENYQFAAQEWLNANGLHNTTIGADASGLDPSTTASIDDLFEIARLALRNPVLSEIMREQSANFPIIGEVRNTNSLLFDNTGYIGIKTGYSARAGSCLMFAAERTIGDSDTTIVGVLMGQVLGTSFDLARTLTDSATNNLVEYDIEAGTTVGIYDVPWGDSVNTITVTEISSVAWKDENPNVVISLDEIYSPIYDNRIVGQVVFGDQSTDIKLDGIISNPNFLWKIKKLSELEWGV